MVQSLTYLAATYSYTTTTTTTTNAGSALGFILGAYAAFLILAIILIIIPLWKIFNKAGQPGWAAIIPLYNNYVLFEIVGYPGWWALLGIIPFVNLFPAVIALISYFKLAKLFDKGDGFAVCTVLFPWVCLPILASKKSQFQGSTQPVAPPAPGAPINPVPPVTTSPDPVAPAPQPPVQPPTQPPVVQG
ncbi:MAG: DUF5684 domain-containing protein [Candidatus Saccharibacteria bacterium]